MPNQDYSVPSRTKKTGAYLGAATLALTTLLLGCGEIRQATTDDTTTTTEDVAQVSPGDPVIGKEVTVRSVVQEPVGKSGFIIENRGAGQPVLVINATGAPFELPAGNIPIQATGRVESLAVADAQKKYNLTLEEGMYREYEGQPAIIAKSLALAPNPEDLAKTPTGYFDKNIAVEGDLRKLEDTPNAFALFEEGWVDDIGVLVVGVDRNLKAKGTPLEEGGNVTVTGVARQADAKLLREANLGWDDAKINEFVSRYTNRPVIIADGVYPSAVNPAPGN